MSSMPKQEGLFTTPQTPLQALACSLFHIIRDVERLLPTCPSQVAARGRGLQQQARPQSRTR